MPVYPNYDPSQPWGVSTPAPTPPMIVAEDVVHIPTQEYRALVRDNEALAGENCVLREENLSLRAKVARMEKQLEYIGR